MKITKKFWLVLALLTLTIFAVYFLKISQFGQAVEHKLGLDISKNDFLFDILIFTQHWPYTVCLQWMERHKGNQCVLPKVRNSWAIHGVWPTKYHEIGPLFCNNSWTFDVNQISDIEQDMEEKWINIWKGTQLESLWKHEWEKHGTCAAQIITGMNTEKKYFQKGLDMFDDFSITKLLSDSNIKPSTDLTYKVDDIFSALNHTIGNSFAVICEIDHKTKQQMLFEIRMCFDKELKLHSCNGIVVQDAIASTGSTDEIITNCKKDQDIFYPSAKMVADREIKEFGF